MDKITKFRGRNYFLSNFYDAPVKYQGLYYQNDEAAFQSAKVIGTKQDNLRKTFTSLKPNDAKRKGRNVILRPDWEKVKDQIMYDIVYDKFTRNKDLKAKLLATGDAELVEGNTWHDTYWGYDFAKKCGKNKLGKILMQVRQELNQD